MQFPFDKLPRISSPFGWRVDPLGRAPKKHHNGVDFAAALGTYIENIHDGVVIFAGKSNRVKPDGSVGGYGFYVQVRMQVLGEWYVATYAHMVAGSIKVKKGQRVTEGTILGRVGSTGDSSGPHLHLEINKGKNYSWSANGSGYVDPIAFIKKVMAFKEVKASIDKATPEDAPVAPIAVHVKPKAVVKPVAKPKLYKVKAGDSYWAIAEKNALDFKALQKLNGGKPLNPGETIRLK